MKKTDDHRDCYRRCFGTPDGRLVLGHILMETGYFDSSVRAEDLSLRNWGVRLVQTLVGFHEEPDKVKALVDRLFDIPQKGTP